MKKIVHTLSDGPQSQNSLLYSGWRWTQHQGVVIFLPHSCCGPRDPLKRTELWAFLTMYLGMSLKKAVVCMRLSVSVCTTIPPFRSLYIQYMYTIQPTFMRGWKENNYEDSPDLPQLYIHIFPASSWPPLPSSPSATEAFRILYVTLICYLQLICSRHCHWQLHSFQPDLIGNCIFVYTRCCFSLQPTEMQCFRGNLWKFTWFFVNSCLAILPALLLADGMYLGISQRLSYTL